MFRCRMGKKTVPGGRKIYTLVLHPDKKKPDTVQWNDTERGSDGSAACGGRSDLSEWQRSTVDAGISMPRRMLGSATGYG